jgi:hypothetical protein
MYVGLVNDSGVEIKAAGYHRVCVDEINWRISPPMDETEINGLINLSEIPFPVAREDWGSVRPALYAEIDSPTPCSFLDSRPVRVDAGQRPVFSPGALHIGISWIDPGRMISDSTTRVQ